MKINLRKEAGNVLMLTLIMGATLGIGIASYFTLVQAQNNAVMRSQNWNSAIPAAEAGLEDALTHLNVLGDLERGTNGWVWTNSYFWISRRFPTFRYDVGIESSNQPAIYSTGYVRAPKGTTEIARVIKVTTSRYRSGMRGMVAIGGVKMNGTTEADSFDSSDPLYSTGGRYDPAKRRDRSYVASVTGNVETGGGKVYGDVATGASGTATGNVGDFAWLGGNSGIQPGHYQKDLNVSFTPPVAPFSSGSYPESNVSVVTTNVAYTSSTITTNVYPSPPPASGVTASTSTYTTTTYPSGASSVTTNTTFVSERSYPASGTYVGSVTTRVVTSGRPDGRGTWYDYQKITGYSYTTTVYTYNVSGETATYSTNTYNYVMRTGNYMMSSVSMAGSESMLIMGDVTLYVTGDFSMTGSSSLTILPGSSLKLYVGGSTTKFAGGGVVNQTDNALALSYFGLPTNTSVAISGNATFTGTIYAPTAEFSMNGGGTDTYDFVGASVSKTVAMNGHFRFHYDERLARDAGASRYSVASWTELSIQ